MLDDKPVKVGDHIIELGKVYNVFKIEKVKSYEGKVEEHVYFKPVFSTADNQTITCCIPLRNIDKANIRRPLPKDRMQELLSGLSNKSINYKTEKNVLLDANDAKDILNQNDAELAIRVLRTMWTELSNEDTNSTKSRRDVFDLSLSRLSQEVAHTFGISLEKAEQKIKDALTRQASS